MAGNGPINTTPVYASNEDVYIRARGDFGTLTNASDQVAAGNDGVIAPNSFWTLTSATIDFQAQGVAAQDIVHLTAPKTSFQGSGRYFAVDSVSPFTMNLRMIGQAPNYGQPPATAAGSTGITFTVTTLNTLIEDASWDLKSRFAIDEMIPFRASSWLYVGVEDEFRDLRAACVLQVLVKALRAENRVKDGDWAMKLNSYKKEYDDVLDRVQLRFGPFGDNQEPITLFSCKLSR